MATGSLLFPIFFLLPIIFLIFNHLRRTSSKGPLPPGPRPWPIIGNLLHMGKKPHIQLAHLAQAHGPLISLKLGTQLIVVGSSPAAATEILKTHDRLLSARYVPHTTPAQRSSRNGSSMVWAAECSGQWKFLRTLCRTELFAAKAIDGQASIREKKVMEMVGHLGAKEGEVIKVGQVVFASVFNMLANVIFSRDFIEMEEREDSGGMKEIVWRMMELGTAINIVDLYPMLDGFDIQGLNKKALKYVEKVHATWEVLVRERRGGKGSKQCDFLDVMLENGFSNDQINTLALELLIAGSDTTASTIEWAMAELIKSPEAMNKAQEELKREIKGNIVKESDLPQLSYLQACVKETLRLHPPAPLLLPHQAPETCTLMNYTIPKDTQVQVNVWAMGRDPVTWKDPLSFTPERFISSDLDYKGNDFEFIPFGAGRRICPGLPMATRQVHLILASLIHCFDWCLPHDMDPTQLDMNEKFGVTLQKENPLLLIPKLRNV
ncbi:probable (S)-N-methylcoclaurine 3'-hydroxylase isozyme 2 [Magnolia sinica]|uniref:probable (S)-N-methylcoclaurine 3'-hydroxylase isozyme 2 n=1 Tax=Magnolia sinica TaxID=86752 RepID=UPI002658113D|nr:probable (S)-N-methylcoclaurine 3'-hydroxylase isozyme 2 [Magnolia sinica]